MESALAELIIVTSYHTGEQNMRKVFQLGRFSGIMRSMNTNNTDWPSIRQEYEHGASKQALSIKHGITRQAIIKQARKGKWIAPLVTSPEYKVTSHVTNALPINMVELSDLEIVEKAIADLYRHLEAGHLELNQHKLFADALSQYRKIKLLIPPEDQEHSADSLRALLDKATNEELTTMLAIIKAIKDREAEGNITPIRKNG
jgi:hypothetical protein